jgi:hypothetical protein
MPVRKPPPEKKLPWFGALFGWIYIFIALVLIVILVIKAPPQRRLVCDSAARATLNQFGTCHEE